MKMTFTQALSRPPVVPTLSAKPTAQEVFAAVKRLHGFLGWCIVLDWEQEGIDTLLTRYKRAKLAFEKK